jgi:hypothetical protein
LEVSIGCRLPEARYEKIGCGGLQRSECTQVAADRNSLKNQ